MFRRESVTFAGEVWVMAYYFNKEGVCVCVCVYISTKRVCVCVCVFSLNWRSRCLKEKGQEAALTNERIFD